MLADRTGQFTNGLSYGDN